MVTIFDMWHILVELTDGTKHTMIFLGAFAAAAIVIGTVVFPFWNFIREEIIEDVEIFESANGKCYVNTSDGIPKTIDNCNIPSGTDVTVKYSDRMPKAIIYSP